MCTLLAHFSFSAFVHCGHILDGHLSGGHFSLGLGFLGLYIWTAPPFVLTFIIIEIHALVLSLSLFTCVWRPSSLALSLLPRVHLSHGIIAGLSAYSTIALPPSCRRFSSRAPPPLEAPSSSRTLSSTLRFCQPLLLFAFLCLRSLLLCVFWCCPSPAPRAGS